MLCCFSDGNAKSNKLYTKTVRQLSYTFQVSIVACSVCAVYDVLYMLGVASSISLAVTPIVIVSSGGDLTEEANSSLLFSGEMSWKDSPYSVFIPLHRGRETVGVTVCPYVQFVCDAVCDAVGLSGNL